MLDLAPTSAAIIGCYAAPDALDALDAAPTLDAIGGREAVVTCRVAHDEAMIVGPRAAADEMLTAAARLVGGDADALVLDATDGWFVWTLTGPSPAAALALMSSIDVRGVAFAQGDVAGVCARILAAPDRLHIVVPAMWAEHLRARVVESCASLGVRCATAARPWPAAAEPPR